MATGVGRVSIVLLRASIRDARGVSVAEYAVLGAGIVFGLAVVTPVFASAVGALIDSINTVLLSLL